MPGVSTPTAEFADLCRTLYGEFVDPEALWAEVSKMSPDPSSVHVMGANMALRPTGRRRRVAKADIPVPAMVKGRLSVMRALSRPDPILAGAERGKQARSARQASEGFSERTQRQERVNAARPKPAAPHAPGVITQTPKAPTPGVAQGAVTSRAAGPITPEGEAQMASAATARAGFDQALSTGAGRVALGAGVGGTYLAGRRSGKSSAYGQMGYAKRDGVVKLDDRRKRQVTAVGSFAGAGVGAYGAGVAVNEIRRNARRTGALRAGLKATPKTTRLLLPAEIAGVGIEGYAGHILHGDTQKKTLQAKRADDVTWGGTFSKFDEDKRLAFGWASVVEVNGQPVIDRQGDYIGIDDVEDAAYVYVQKSRVGGDMHRRVGGKFDGAQDRPHHVADLVESMVFTPEKIAKMGLPDDFPVGWWVGFKVFDDEAWTEAKEGRRTGFSIHGKGIRKDVDYDSLMGA